MFWVEEIPAARTARTVGGLSPSSRSDIQSAADDFERTQTSWYERERIDQLANDFDTASEANGWGLKYPRSAHKTLVGLAAPILPSVGAGEFGAFAAPPDAFEEVAQARLEADAFNETIRLMRSTNAELAGLKTTDEAEAEYLKDIKVKQERAERMGSRGGSNYFETFEFGDLVSARTAAETWAGIKTGFTEPDNLAAMGVGLAAAPLLPAAAAGASLLTRIGAHAATYVMDAGINAAAQATISERLEGLRLRLGYSEEEVANMSRQEIMMAAGAGLVLGPVFDGIWMGGAKVFGLALKDAKATGADAATISELEILSRVENLNSPVARERIAAIEWLEKNVPLSGEEKDLFKSAKRDAALELTNPFGTESQLREHFARLVQGEKLAKGIDDPSAILDPLDFAEQWVDQKMMAKHSEDWRSKGAALADDAAKLHEEFRANPMKLLFAEQEGRRADFRFADPIPEPKRTKGASPFIDEDEPRSLVQFIIDNGGLRDDTFSKRVNNARGRADARSRPSDLRAMDADKVRGLVRAKKGLSLEEMAELAFQHGYLREYAHDIGNGMATPNDLLDALSRELGGVKSYSRDDAAAFDAWTRAKATNEEVAELASVYGIDPDGLTYDDFMAIAAERASLTDIEATDRAIAEFYREELEAARTAHEAWLADRGDAFEPDLDYDRSSPATLADLERISGDAGGSRSGDGGSAATPSGEPAARTAGPVASGDRARAEAADLARSEGTQTGFGAVASALLKRLQTPPEVSAQLKSVLTLSNPEDITPELVAARAELVELQGERIVVDPERGMEVTMRDLLTKDADDIAALEEITSCMLSGVA